MRVILIVAMLVASACAKVHHAPAGVTLLKEGPVVDTELFDRMVRETANAWQGALHARGVWCDAWDMDVTVRFVRESNLAGWYRSGFVEIRWEEDMRDTALVHELSHAILDKCARRVVGMHSLMACMSKLEPRLVTATQLRGDQCE